MTFLPILGLIGYAAGNGVSPVLQKIGADHEKRPKTIDLAIILRVMKNKPYLLGIGLQIAGLILGLVALRVLPLFLVQSVLAASIVVTAITERLVSHHKLNRKTVISIMVVLIGLALLSLTAEASRAVVTVPRIRLSIELAPLLLIVLGLACICRKGRLSGILIALISGTGFGAMAIIGRIIIYPSPFWHILIDPMFWSLIIYGLIAQFLFIVSLQRGSGTTMNALTSVTGTLAPAVTGIILFNDKIRAGFEFVLIIGAILIVIGSLAIAQFDNDLPENFVL